MYAAADFFWPCADSACIGQAGWYLWVGSVYFQIFLTEKPRKSKSCTPRRIFLAMCWISLYRQSGSISMSQISSFPDLHYRKVTRIQIMSAMADFRQALIQPASVEYKPLIMLIDTDCSFIGLFVHNQQKLDLLMQREPQRSDRILKKTLLWRGTRTLNGNCLL